MRNANTHIRVTFSVMETENVVSAEIVNMSIIESSCFMHLNPDRPIDGEQLTDSFIHAVESTVNDLLSKCLLGFYKPKPEDD